MAQPMDFGQERPCNLHDRVAVGSRLHKELFCGMLLDSFDPYKPAAIDWPPLAADALARLRQLPFWDIALETEESAGSCMQALADATSDPLIRKALALNAFEERRHKDVICNMLRHYAIPIKGEGAPRAPRNPIWAFLRTGYGECFDSFFAYGLFALARQSGFFPPDLIGVFEPVIQEEARHNLFFVNWVAYMRAQQAPAIRMIFAARCLAALAIQMWKRVGTAHTVDGDNFTRTGGEALGLGLTPTRFLRVCLTENERRLAPYDSRLLRPRIMPAVARAVMRILPG